MSSLINALSYPLFKSRNDPNAWVIAFFCWGASSSGGQAPPQELRRPAGGRDPKWRPPCAWRTDTAQPTGEFWALESTREYAERPHFHARAHTALPVPNASQ